MWRFIAGNLGLHNKGLQPIIKNIEEFPMRISSLFLFLSLIMNLDCARSNPIISESLVEQSFFSGSYVQTHDYDGGQEVDLGGQN